MTDWLLLTVNYSFTEKKYDDFVQADTVLPVMALAARLWAAESGRLRSPDNDHASIRLRADTSANGETRLLLDVKLENGWKTYWRAPGKGAWRPLSPGKATCLR